MTADDAREFAGRWRTAWNSRRPDEVLALCAPDVAWEDPLTEGRERGPIAVRRYLESLWGAFPDMELTGPRRRCAPSKRAGSPAAGG